MVHIATIDVRFAELDPYGHVNHAVYLTYLEVARTEALAACGIPIHELAERGVQLVVTAIEARYRGAAVAGDTLRIETAVGELRRARGTWRQRILRGEDELVTAEVTAGITDNEGRPTRPPDWLFPALEPLLDSHL